MAKAENLVIMFTDIVGFTELTSTQSRDQNEAMLRQHERLLIGVAKKFGGKRIKSIGDALLLIFRSPTDAVHCGMAMHDALWELNQTLENESDQLSIRIALNSGEVRLQSGDVFGEPVNVAARLEGITPPNEVYFTEAIYLSMNKAEVMHEFVSKEKLKGIPEEIDIYRVPRGASAQRLVAVSSDDDDEIAKKQYPYGGMHRLEKSKSTSIGKNLPLKKIGVAAAIILALVAVTLLVPPLISNIDSPDSTETDFTELNQLLDSNDLTELETRLSEILIDEPDSAAAWFMMGHINFEKRSFKDGLENYSLAISQQPSLAENERYANNLIQGLSGNGALVTELVRESPTEQVVDRLSERSISAGLNGRRDAAYILRLIDRQDKMDSVAMAILDLEESSTCEDRQDAIAILKARKDARAIPALEAITKSGVAGLFKNSCVRKDAREALDAINGQTSA